VRLLTNLAIPGWATFTSGLLFILVAQSGATLLTITFSVMMNRNTLGFLPIRGYEYFVSECVEIRSRPMAQEFLADQVSRQVR
jgi:polyisoprenyl-phosphate glycosyltransferase